MALAFLIPVAVVTIAVATKDVNFKFKLHLL